MSLLLCCHTVTCAFKLTLFSHNVRTHSSYVDVGGGGGGCVQMYGKENRLSLSCAGLPSASSSMLGDSASALAQGTTNKRQQMLKYSASRRLSLKLPPKRGKVRQESR